MISEKMTREINAQINREFFSAFLYLAMANDALDKGFNGTYNWMTLQFNEEQEHALKFSKYLQDRGVRVELTAMDAPKTSWNSILEMYEDALDHEKKVTAWINDLYTLALEEKDYATQNMLQWFIEEQVEEEANVSDAISQISMVQNSAGGLYNVDRQLGKRTE